jgi:hypothetical protein
MIEGAALTLVPAMAIYQHIPAFFILGIFCGFGFLINERTKRRPLKYLPKPSQKFRFASVFSKRVILRNS